MLILLGANYLTDGASSLAKRFKISDLVIGLTVVAFGTSAPELAVSLSSAIKGSADIAIGNVVGSNIFNIGIVLGVPVALFGSVQAVGFNLIDLITMIVSAFLLFVFAYKDHEIHRREGIIMLVLFVIYYSYVIFG